MSNKYQDAHFIVENILLNIGNDYEETLDALSLLDDLVARATPRNVKSISCGDCECAMCGMLVERPDKFCRQCGYALNWEGLHEIPNEN